MSRRIKNPVPPGKRSRLYAAIDLFKRFRGTDPEYIETHKINMPEVALLIGHLDGVLYTTIRDGVTEKYVHKFKLKSRPLLCTSHDGTQLIILGGEYDFTELGIVDRK